MAKRHPLPFFPISLLVLSFLLAGCSLQGSEIRTPQAPPPKATTPTPTMFTPPTPFAGGTIWLAPSLPQSFAELWDIEPLKAYGFDVVPETSQADVQIGSNGDELLATWVYALVAPFPTTTDGLSWDALKELWSIDTTDIPLFVAQSELAALELLLGEPGENVRVVSGDGLLDIAWVGGEALAVVSFEALEPRWKVLELDGQSPIHADFDPAIYPLRLDIYLEGPQGAAAHLRDVLVIPYSNYDQEQMTVLVMTGVTALTRATAWQINRRGVDFPAEKIGDWLVGADLTHISNEVAFTPDCPLPDPQQEGLKFCSDPDHIEVLDRIGTDIVELTGNHVRDYGSDALLLTLQAYEERGWGVFGGGENLSAAFEPLLVEHNGNRLAFLGCNYAGPRYALATEQDPGSTPCDTERLFDLVAELNGEGYQVIFTYQWIELNAVTEEQEGAFKAAVEAGAVIVSGTQAHQPLGMTFYEDGFIHYGLGNLFFDQMQTPTLRSELIDRHVFYAGRHISTELLTAFLESYAQPRPMTEIERTVLLESLFESSGW